MQTQTDLVTDTLRIWRWFPRSNKMTSSTTGPSRDERDETAFDVSKGSRKSYRHDQTCGVYICSTDYRSEIQYRSYGPVLAINIRPILQARFLSYHTTMRTARTVPGQNNELVHNTASLFRDEEFRGTLLTMTQSKY